MKSIELFAGIGGISLAAEWAGIETVAFCEIDDYAGKVLKKNWPNVPLFKDIKKLNRQVLEETGVIEKGGTVELISGGWPCQPYSVAGERKGDADDRALWGEMFRLIEEIRPRWIVGENVANFSNMGLGNTLSDLENIGYTTQSFIIPAAAVKASHRRDRVFVVAHSDSHGLQGVQSEEVQRERSVQGDENRRGFTEYIRRSDLYEPKLCRSLAGIPGGVDRLRCLGNAVVPQQIYPIFEAIVKIKEETK